MHTFRTLGIVASALAVLLASTVAFAEERATVTARVDAGGENSVMASTTAKHTEAQREDTKAKAEAFREKAEQRVSDIRDKAKQQLARRLATQFDELNKKWTDHFTDELNHYDALLKKIKNRAATLTGMDVTATNAAVQAAATAIASARDAVALQAAKSYTPDTAITVTATSTTSGQEKILQGLRKSFQALHAALFKDLFALRDGAMADARKALQRAIATLGPVTRDDRNASSTKTSDN